MAVQFILGRAGAGKTWHCLRRIESLVKADPLGPPIYWVLPRQATFQAERELTARLVAFTRVHVVSFELLGQEILDACGDVGMPNITAAGRRLVVGQLLRQHQKDLRFYSASAHHPGLAAELDGIFGELDQAGLDSATLKTALEAANAGSPLSDSLIDKLHDLQLLMREYEKSLGNDRLDPARRFKRVLERVAQCDRLTNATLLADDFFDFTANERGLLVAVAGAVASADITLLIDPSSTVVIDPHQHPDDLSAMHRTERAYRKLFWALTNAGVRIEPPLKLMESHRATAADLKHLQQDDVQPFTGTPEHIEWIEAPDARAEVDAVARRIDDLLATGSLRRRDAAVLVRQMDKYQERIESSFREHNRLRYFIDCRRAAVHHPLLRFCRCALLLADGKWSHDAVMSLLKTGLAGVNDEQTDALENYALRHRIRGKRWGAAEPWNFERDDLSDDSAGVDEARRSVADRLALLIDLFKQNPTPKVHDVLAELFALIERFEVRPALSRWICTADRNGHLEQAAEHRAVWTELTELLVHFDELLGDTTISLDDFLAVLDAGLERFDLGLTPPTVDQIIVGEIGRTRLPEVKVVFVLGLNEQLFPKVGSENAVLSDSERRVLRDRQIDVSPETDRQLLDERLLAYVAFTRPSQQLILSRYTTEAGAKARPTNPSTCWNQTLARFPNAQVQQIKQTESETAADIATPRQLVTALMRWARDGDANTVYPALYNWFVADDDLAIASLRAMAWPALSYRNDAAISDELAYALFTSPLQATARELETQAECPYRHFARHGLALRPRESPDVTGLDLSSAYHRALQQFTTELLNDGLDWAELTAEQIDERLLPLVQRVGESLRSRIFMSSARSRYELHRITQMLRLTILAQQAIFKRGKYRPAKVGIQFGDQSDSPPLKLDVGEGAELHLRGAIDRVDLHPNGLSCSLVDYSLRSKTLNLSDALNGLALQLLSALLAVRENSLALLGRNAAPIGAFYMPLLRSPRKVLHPDDGKSPQHPDFHLAVKPRGIFDKRAIPALDPSTTAGWSSALSLYVNKTGEPGNISGTDVATQDELNGLYDRVKEKLIELAGEIMAGDMAVSPYRIGQRSPCSHCEYRAVCRFQPGLDRYRHLNSDRRDTVLASLTVGGESDFG